MTRLTQRDKLGSGLNTIHAYIPKARDVYAMDNLHESALRVIANKGSHGSDYVTVEMLKYNLVECLSKLQQELITERYAPKPVRKVDIPKGDNGHRTLSIPTVIDRVAQQALLNVMEPPFEELFMDCSYGFRKGKRAHDALDKVSQYIYEGYQWVVKGDISNYFNTIPHEELISRVNRIIKDEGIICLAEKMMGKQNNHLFEGCAEGVAQGSVISPLLANIYLHDFDEYLLMNNSKLVRYADDYVILYKDEVTARKGLEDSLAFLNNQLKLQSKDKDGRGGATHLKDTFNFLGYTFYNGGIKPSIRTPYKFISNMELNLKKAVRKNKRAMSLDEVITLANRMTIGWINYYGMGNGADLFKDTDTMLRAKVREWANGDRPRPMPNQELANAGLISVLEEYHKKKRSISCPPAY